MKVAFVSSDWAPGEGDAPPTPGGAGYYRCALPCAALRAHGVDAGHFPNFGVNKQTGELLPVGFDGVGHDGYDVLVFQRWMQRDGDRVIRHARSNGQVVINDIDDWYDGLSPHNAAFAATHPKSSPDMNRNHYRSILAASDALWVSTPYLGGRLAKLGVPVFVLRNMIDLSLWTAKPVVDGWGPALGWVGATPWRSGDLETLRGVLGPVVERHGLRFFHGGHSPFARPAAALLDLPSTGQCCVLNMVPIDRYPDLFAPIEVGVVPLAHAPFNEAKSAIKGMEYSAAGVPFVGPDWGEYAWYGAGAQAGRPRDWRRHLERLLEPCERELQRDRQLRRVRLEDVNVRWADWAEALRATPQMRGANYRRVRATLDHFEAEMARVAPDLSEETRRAVGGIA